MTTSTSDLSTPEGLADAIDGTFADAPSPSDDLVARGFKLLPEVLAEMGQMFVPPPEELTMMIYGSPGVGKTSLVAGRPGTLFLATEPGTEFLHASQVYLKDWHHFQGIVDEIVELKAQGVCPYRSVAIDIIDNLSGLCLDAVCAAKGVTYPPENDFGKTWRQIRVVWETQLRRLMEVVNVTYLTHCSVEKREVKGKVGKKEVDVYMPTFKGNKLAQYLDGVVHAVGFISKNDQDQHTINFENLATSGAKDRTGLLSVLGDIVIQVPGGDPKAAWAKFADAYRARAEQVNFKIKSRWDA